MKEFDVIIIGGGVIGLSIATALKVNNTSIKVLLVDKEPLLGMHASGRNSGVIHAGFYYSPDSLKAKFCSIGNIKLSDLIARHKIPILKCGKVVVTRNSSEELQIEKLYSRGVANGIDIRVLPRIALKNIEPLATTYENFLWSPNTAVSDPSLVIKAMQKEAEASGVEFALESKLNVGDSDAQINGERIAFRHLVNCAGSYALDVARTYGFGGKYLTLPFIGRYLKSSENYFSLKALVYPVPHPINPFLGVHLTKTIDGNVKIGPTAFPLFGKEQYSIFKGIKISEIFESINGLVSLIKGSAHDVSELLINELPKISARKLIEEVSSISPEIKNVRHWRPSPAGIRAQLVDILNGEFVQDFIIEGDFNSTHVLNAVSPGWTSSIPFGDYIANHILDKL